MWPAPMMRIKYVEKPYAKAAMIATQAFTPKSSIASHIAVIVKKRNDAGVSITFTTLPIVPLTACEG